MIFFFSYLNSRLTEAKSFTEFLPHEGVRVVSLVKQSLKLPKLLHTEY